MQIFPPAHGLSSPSLDVVFHRAEVFNFSEDQFNDYFFHESRIISKKAPSMHHSFLWYLLRVSYLKVLPIRL